MVTIFCHAHHRTSTGKGDQALSRALYVDGEIYARNAWKSMSDVGS